MGGGQSTPIPGGGTHGYHVLKVQENSPAALSQLEAYFDFIVTIQGLRLDRESDTLIEILKVHLDREVKLGVYNVKGRSWREVGLVPNKKWGGQGVIGVSIRFCSFENVSDNIWHILEVYPNSPADKAGLCSNTDYIIGYEMMDEEFDTFIEQNNRKEVKLFVYNVTSDKCRDVVIIPDVNWGGEGSLGCGVGTGYLHRIPIVTANSSKDKSTSRKTDVEVGDNSLVSEFSNLNILPMSPKKVSNDKPGETQPIAVPTQNIIQQEIPSRPIESLVPSLTAQEPYLPSVQDMNRGQEQEKRSPIPTASQKNLFTTHFAPNTLVSPSSGLPTAPPVDFNLEIPDGTFLHTQQPVYTPEPIFKPMPDTLTPSQPSYTAPSPPTIEEVN
eukprot:TRINITY_DN6925_c2_g1_i1.p1 TRINITY_DN6925_c2_g1~~TRINITY_DN6925_c2_g1_i1.p1  ORF type:complete len:385 (+),score=75.83 TRINITY_DN6925_c2_g1_i1:692-1846(+)